MGNCDPTLSRRDFAVFSAAFVAVPTAALDATKPLNPLPVTDPVFRLIDEHRAASNRYAQRREWVRRLEAERPADCLLVGESYDVDFTKTEEEKLAEARGDAWSLVSGHDHAVKLMNAAVDEIDQAERAILMAKPTTAAGVVAVLEFLHQHYGEFHGLDEAANTFQRLAEAVRRVA